MFLDIARRVHYSIYDAHAILEGSDLVVYRYVPIVGNNEFRRKEVCRVKGDFTVVGDCSFTVGYINRIIQQQ